MATINTIRKTKGRKPAAPKAKTAEGAPAYVPDALAQLRRSVMSCLLWEDEFYESGEKIATRIAKLVEQVDPREVVATAIEAREQQNLRHVPLLLIDALAKSTDPARRGVVGDALSRVIQRADELTEFLAIYWRDKKQPLAAQVKKGLARAFTKFNAYSLAKYNREGAVRLRDVLFLSHAKPKDDDQAAAWKRLVDGTLPAPDTWEVALSAGADKRATWERLIFTGQLGGLAMLRNLRNMQEANVCDACIRTGLASADFSRVLPFRFLAAAKYAPRFEPELEAAMLKGLAGAPKLAGKTALVIDGSGSMFQANVSAKSDITRFEAAAALAILLREIAEDITVYVFSNSVIHVPARHGFALRDVLFTNAEQGGTDTQRAKQLADRDGYDRIIIVTDEQSHTALTAPKGTGYVVNVASNKNGIGYGPWTHIDGWSESIVRYISALEPSGAIGQR